MPQTLSVGYASSCLSFSHCAAWTVESVTKDVEWLIAEMFHTGMEVDAHNSITKRATQSATIIDEPSLYVEANMCNTLNT